MFSYLLEAIGACTLSVYSKCCELVEYGVKLADGITVKVGEAEVTATFYGVGEGK